MPARALGLALGLAVASPAAAGAAGGDALRPWHGGEAVAPALPAAALRGPPLDLPSLRGRAVVVAFWASWCEPCAEELPALARLRDRLAGRPFALLTVNLGEAPGKAEALLAGLGLDLPVLLDRDQAAARAWGVGGLPMAFLVGPDGKVVGSRFGACDWSSGAPGEALEAALRAAEGRTR